MHSGRGQLLQVQVKLMFNSKDKYSLKELLQDKFTDLDIIREKPFVFKVNKYLLITTPVYFGEYDKFLHDMSYMLQEYYKVFIDLDFLTALNYRDPGAIEKIVAHVKIFEANEDFRKFQKDTIEFVSKWVFVSTKKRGTVKLKHSKKKAKKALKIMKGDEVVHLLFLLFVFNFDVVKKNLGALMKNFIGEEQPRKSKSSPPTQSSKTVKKKVVMPKYSEKPYPKEVLDIFAEQSTMS